MSRRCKKCDQLLLADETKCWYCGQEVAEAEALTQTGLAEEAASPTSALAVYTGLTGVVIVAALLVTAFLGRQPRVERVQVRIPDNWQAVTDQARTFTVFLPQEWSTLDAADAGQREQLEEALARNETYRLATAPLGNAVDDVETIFLAAGGDPAAAAMPSPFIVVARSATLNRLAPAAALELTRADPNAVGEAIVTEDYNHRILSLVVEPPETDLVCRQQFTSGEAVGLLAAVCARSAVEQSTAARIIDTFQRLAR
jgi:hypothetical protein